MRIFRIVIKILILTIIAFAIIVFSLLRHNQYLRTFQSAHEIAHASDVVRGKAEVQFEKNRALIELLEETLKKRKEGNLKFHEKQDSIQIQFLILKAKSLHQTNSLLFKNLLEDTASYFFYGRELTLYQDKNNNQPFENKNTLEAEIITSEQHSSKTRVQLLSFLKLTEPYPKSQTAQRQYNTLVNLANLTPEKFYEEVYSDSKAYIVLSETAIIKSCLAGIESNCIDQIEAKINLLLENDKPFNSTWFAYVPNTPAIIKTGDTLKLTARLSSYPVLINPKLMETAFSFKGGKIDSIQFNSFAYISFTTDYQNSRKQKLRNELEKKKFSLKLKHANNKLDTIFSGEFKYPIRRLKQQKSEE